MTQRYLSQARSAGVGGQIVYQLGSLDDAFTFDDGNNPGYVTAGLGFDDVNDPGDGGKLSGVLT